MATATKRSPQGEAAGSIQLPQVFETDVNEPTLHQALVRTMAGARQGTHATKTRSTVSGGGRKPYRQKGTGRARQGSIRAPQWKGGGTVFGPTPRSYAKDMPRKQRRLALRSALAAKAAQGSVQVVPELDFQEPKTRQMATLLDRMEAGRRVLLVMAEHSENVELSARNIPQLRLVLAANLNVRDLLSAETLIISEPALEAIQEHLG